MEIRIRILLGYQFNHPWWLLVFIFNTLHTILGLVEHDQLCADIFISGGSKQNNDDLPKVTDRGVGGRPVTSGRGDISWVYSD